METTRDRAAAAEEALGPYPWRRLTTVMLARRVIAAADAGGPVPCDDPRVDALVACLSGTQWRASTVAALVRRLLDALDAWQDRDLCLDLELAWLLDEGV